MNCGVTITGMVRLLLCILAALAAGAQEAPTSSSHFAVVLERGPNWLPGKTASQQPLGEHGRYLHRLMVTGKLVLAGPFLDDQGGFILLKAASLAEAQQIENQDPAIQKGILRPTVHPFTIAFDSATGASPFKGSVP
jgi:uncharacterized protein YciI